MQAIILCNIQFNNVMLDRLLMITLAQDGKEKAAVVICSCNLSYLVAVNASTTLSKNATSSIGPP
jgi:hypothetical protein